MLDFLAYWLVAGIIIWLLGAFGALGGISKPASFIGFLMTIGGVLGVIFWTIYSVVGGI